MLKVNLSGWLLTSFFRVKKNVTSYTLARQKTQGRPVTKRTMGEEVEVCGVTKGKPPSFICRLNKCRQLYILHKESITIRNPVPTSPHSTMDGGFFFITRRKTRTV